MLKKVCVVVIGFSLCFGMLGCGTKKATVPKAGTVEKAPADQQQKNKAAKATSASRIVRLNLTHPWVLPRQVPRGFF